MKREYHPLWELVLARLREFVRQPEAVFWVYIFPVIMMVVLGIAFRSRPVRSLQVDIVQGAGAEQLAAALEHDDRFEVSLQDAKAARDRLRAGRTDVVIEQTAADGTPLYEYYVDPTQPRSLLAKESAADALQRSAGRTDKVPSRQHAMTEPGGRYVDFLVPGLLGLGLMGGGLWGVGFAIVDLRIRKLLKRYVATPMRRSDFLLAMMISRLVFTVSECVLVLAVAWLLFAVSNHGSYLALSLLIVLGAFEFAGIGLLVASRVETLEAVSGLMNLVMLPMWIASGVFYSIERFPEVLQPILRLLPLTPLIEAIRATMLEGTPLTALLPQVGLCLAWGLVTFGLALRWFRWS